MFKFSIIVPVYNVEAFLEECLLSISSQTFKDFEVILVDDGSTDRSPLICDNFQKDNSNAVVIHKTNGGLVSARKAGIEKARGTYIVNIDGDDYVPNTLLSELNNIIEKKGAPDIVCYSYQAITSDGHPLYVYNDPEKPGLYIDRELEKIRHRLIYDIHNKHFNNGSISYSLWSKAIKREILYTNQTIIDNSISLGEDAAVSVPCIVQCRSLFVSYFIGYYYRQRSTSICYQFNKQQIDSSFKVIKRFKEIGSIDLSYNITAYGTKALICNLVSAAKAIKHYQEFYNYYKHIMSYPEVQEIIHVRIELILYYRAIKFLIANDHPFPFYFLYHYLRPLFDNKFFFFSFSVPKG